MKIRTLNHTAASIFGFRSLLAGHEPIKVVLPHGELELHPFGSVLSRTEYYGLTRAAGLVEARAVMAHHRLVVGDLSSDHLAAAA
jgi:hypothetical protein